MMHPNARDVTSSRINRARRRRDPDHRSRRDPRKLPAAARPPRRRAMRRRGQGRRLWARRSGGVAGAARGRLQRLLRRASRGGARAARGAWRGRRNLRAERRSPGRREPGRAGWADRRLQQPRAACTPGGARPGDPARACRSPCRSTAACRGSAWRRRGRGRRGRCRGLRRARSQAGDEPPRLRRRSRQSGQRIRSAATSRLCGRHLPAAPASLANSSGIFLGEHFRYDLARPGAALYGINPTPGRAESDAAGRAAGGEGHPDARRCEPASASATAMTWRGAAARRLATIALGYADGWPRRAAASALRWRHATALCRPRVDGQHHPRHLGAAGGPARAGRPRRADRRRSRRSTSWRRPPARSATRS